MIEEKLYLTLKARLKVDQMRLDEELMEQPVLLQQAAEVTAKALADRDTSKFNLDIAQADAAQRLRSMSDKDGKAPSEAKINTLLFLDEDVQRCSILHLDAKADAALWATLVDAFSEKGSAMRRVAELTTAGYLSRNDDYAQNRKELAKRRERQGTT